MRDSGFHKIHARPAFSRANLSDPPVIHRNPQVIHIIKQHNEHAPAANPVPAKPSGQRIPVENLKNQKFGSEVVKSVILCQ